MKQANRDILLDSSLAVTPPEPPIESKPHPEPILSESSSSRAEILSSTFFELSERRLRTGRAVIYLD
jgi:hypothetical protein